MTILTKIISELNSKWGSFTYSLYRKLYYKWQLYRRFNKCEYYGPWEMSEYLMDITFEMFCEFYENGGIEHIEWNSDEWHKHAKEEMDYLYKWWTKDRHEREEEIDTILDEWCIRHVVWWEEVDNGSYYHYHSTSSRYTEYLSGLLHRLEYALEQEEEDNLIRLVKIKGYLWT
jgi:hypothetical protein